MFVILMKAIAKKERVRVMQRNSKVFIEELNKEIRKREFYNTAFSFLNSKERRKRNKLKLHELENKLILEKLKNAL